MEQRASIPTGLPKANPTTSYWQDPPASLSQHRTTSSLPSSASVVIVGSGITGVSLAYTLLSQNPSQNPVPTIVLLEARTACSGATGRNGGHTKCASYRSFLENVNNLGQEEAAKIVRFEYNCMKSVHAFARDNNIDCDSWEGDTVDVIYDKKEWDLAHAAVKAIRRILGEEDNAAKYKFWDANDTERKFLTKGALGAVSYQAGSISAYKFVIGILELALSKGLNLQTGTPALQVYRAERGWIVETSRGAIHADKVVLATNGYTARLYPALQGVIVPLRGHVTAHRPGHRMPKEGLSLTYSFIYANSYEYMITRPQGSKFAGDIIIGGGSTMAAEEGLNEFGTVDDSATDPIIVDYLHDSTLKYFGDYWGHDDSEGRVRKVWSGIMGYSADGFPFIGEVPEEKGLFIAASFQGHGMVLCLSAVKALVEIINDTEGGNVDSWFPKAFRVTGERLKHEFKGRLHSTTPKNLELKSQS